MLGAPADVWLVVLADADGVVEGVCARANADMLVRIAKLKQYLNVDRKFSSEGFFPVRLILVGLYPGSQLIFPPDRDDALGGRRQLTPEQHQRGHHRRPHKQSEKLKTL